MQACARPIPSVTHARYIASSHTHTHTRLYAHTPTLAHTRAHTRHALTRAHVYRTRCGRATRTYAVVSCTHNARAVGSRNTRSLGIELAPRRGHHHRLSVCLLLCTHLCSGSRRAQDDGYHTGCTAAATRGFRFFEFFSAHTAYREHGNNHVGLYAAVQGKEKEKKRYFR